MSGIQIAEAKAPWVMFDRRAVEDRAASIAAGAYRARDVDYVLVTPHGSKDQFEIEAEDWFRQKDQDVREGRFSADWLKAYKRAFAEWKEGREIPLEGTPIVNWPVLSPAQVRMMQDMHVLTVEVLANANEELIKRLGMGGRTLVDKAKDFLAQAENGGKVVEELAALRAEKEGLAATVQHLSEQVAMLKAGQTTMKEAVPNAPLPGAEDISSGDLFDTPAPAARKL